MPDIVDVILERLTPSSLDLLDRLDIESNRTSRDVCEVLQKSLEKMENICMNGSARELNDAAELLIAKAKKNKFSLENYTSQFDKVKRIEKHPDYTQKIKIYDQQIDSLQEQLTHLMQESGETEPEKLFLQIDETFKSISELEVQVKDVKERLKSYDDFPATLEEAEDCISDAKERIKEKEALLESLFNKNEKQ